MRAFVQGSGPDRKYVCIDVLGKTMTVISGKGDAPPKRQEKELSSEREARAALEKMASEMQARGFVEQRAEAGKPSPARDRTGQVRGGPPPAPKPKAEPDPEDNYALADLDTPEAVVVPRKSTGSNGVDADPPRKGKSRRGEEPTEVSEGPVLQRMGLVADATAAPKPKKKKKRKKRAKEPGEKPDFLFIGGLSAAGLLLVGVLGWFTWSTFFKPVSIVGTWAGSRVEKEPGGPIIYRQYRLALTDQGRARMVFDGELEMAGTYRVEGDRLELAFTDEEGDTSDMEYKIDLSSVTLTLMEPGDGATVVELIRQREMDAVPGAGGGEATAAKKPAAPGELPDLDPTLVSKAWSDKNGAFNCSYPDGWEAEGGGSADRRVSWARFTQGSATVKIDAGTASSLIADISRNAGGGEGDESPVAAAHDFNLHSISESFDEFKEGPARSFQHASGLGEGRIAEFTAGGSGFFSTKLRGYHATLLVQNHALTVLCSCPEKQWESLKPTFFAAIQGIKR